MNLNLVEKDPGEGLSVSSLSNSPWELGKAFSQLRPQDHLHSMDQSLEIPKGAESKSYEANSSAVKFLPPSVF